MKARVSERVLRRSGAQVGSRVSIKGEIEDDARNGFHMKTILKIGTSIVAILPGYVASAEQVQDLASGKVSLLKHDGGYSSH